MVSSGVIAVLGTISGSLVSAVVVIYTTKVQQKKESDRVRAEYYLEKKVECLHELNQKLVQLDNSIGPVPYWDQSDDFHFQREDIILSIEELNEYKRAALKAELYLSKSQYKAHEDLIIVYQRILFDIYENYGGDIETGRRIDEETYARYLNRAKDAIRNEISDPIDSINNP